MAKREISKIAERDVYISPQSMTEEPLLSQQSTQYILPKVLTRTDMLVLFIVIVLFIPKVAVEQAIQSAGAYTYLYWLLGIFTFLVPGAIVAAQLNRILPVNGSLYVWTHRALGPLWGFFAGFCTWFPGILMIMVAGNTALSILRSIGTLIFGQHNPWLLTPWQQGFLLIGILLLSGWLSQFPLTLIMKIAKVSVIFYGLGILTIGLSGAVWLFSGHPLMLTQAITLPHQDNILEHTAMFGVVLLALFGVEVPLNMANETKQHGIATFALKWGTVVVGIAYLIVTFGVTSVLPLNTMPLLYNPLTAVRIVFGTPIAVLVGSACICFFVVSTVVYNVTYARILFVSALDYRFPNSLARVNRHKAPFRATNLQTFIVLCIVALAYFVVPMLLSVFKIDFVSSPGSDYLIKVYQVTLVCTIILWCISMITLFIDLPVLLYRFRDDFKYKKELFLFSPWFLYLCCLIGTSAAIIGIIITIFVPLDTHIYEADLWAKIVGICVTSILVVGLIGAAYPRLIGKLNKQTDVARENERLYRELHAAYEKLSYLDQLKDAFLVTASHELRTPLTIVQGYLELLGEMHEERLNVQTRQIFINKARRACDELVLTLTNVMDAGRLDIETATLYYTSFSLHKVCTDIVDLFESIIYQQTRIVTINVPIDTMIEADEGRLKQILHNLITNALRYSPPQSALTITAQLEIEQVRISVTDLGLGIPLDKQKVIFDRFVRLERDTHGDIRGSGLGLAICRQLVEAMHGTITVESTGVKGEGSTFSFTLPLKAQQS